MNRIIPKLVVSTAGGSDPDVLEIDDAREAVGDWPEIIDHCDKSPTGQHQYGYPDDTVCIHCGKESGL